MSASPEEPVFKRKRVSRACDPCRVMKSKCDGKRPICARCQGYGYSCAYSQPRNRPNRFKHEAVLSAVHLPSRESVQISALREAVQDLERILTEVIPALPGEQQRSVDLDVQSAKSRVEEAFSQLDESEVRSWESQVPSRRSSRAIFNPERYLGEVSDVRFFNLVKRAFQENGSTLHAEDGHGMDSYEQNGHPTTDDSSTNMHFALPDPDIAQGYLDAYFSTIHIAYPFIPQSTFLKNYNLLRSSGVNEETDACWLALLHIIFAIGSYYQSFPGHDEAARTEHGKFFQRALSLAKIERAERSPEYVMFLLGQCFYLLAVCNTDRCWIVLGQAIRFAQSIGLHVEDEIAGVPPTRTQLKAEARRRIWYCVYVLDRLLSLQLGRPPAIHDDDSHVGLPWRTNPADIDWEGDQLPALLINGGPSAGDYFLSMITFSRIVGFVLRELYHPKREKLAMTELLSTRSLDARLMEWKTSLPRHLRFDLGHTFEKSVTFRRQRNMLAIKFHHLRALIHRPYLCLPLLRKQDNAVVSMLQPELLEVKRYENICVSEAQKTARLLHDVADEKELVHNFPWWQMISCLICASSILLVASSFASYIPVKEDYDVTALTEDLDTCLHVFEALSSNSDAARIAKDMMKKLRDRGLALVHPESSFPTPKEPADQQLPAPHGSLPELNPVFFDTPNDMNLLTSQDWPSEIFDSMAWSTRFFNTGSNQINQ